MIFGEKYQVALIGLGAAATVLFGVFFYRELFPEYRIYQDTYVALEELRSTFTHEPPPIFKFGVKQLVKESPTNGPAEIDRCTSCHVSLEFEHFSPTKIERDVNGQIARDLNGFPKQVPNENYVWALLDKKVAEVGKDSSEGRYLESLKTADVHGDVYDVTKVLRMHPLIGRETRPFEFHPVEEYGCTSCHNGNGRGLTTPKAHGPVFDGQYEAEFTGYRPQFLEIDAVNDPAFSRVFNGKPGHELLFQTSPIYVGALIQAKCVQCHQSAKEALEGASGIAEILVAQRDRRSKAIQSAFNQEEEALISLVKLRNSVQADGLPATLKALQDIVANPASSSASVDEAAAQELFLRTLQGANVEQELQAKLVDALGSKELADDLTAILSNSKAPKDDLEAFVQKYKGDKTAKGTFFVKAIQYDLDAKLMEHVLETQTGIQNLTKEAEVSGAMETDVDLLTRDYQNGKELFISQGCYACHRISGFARGGVGPELTFEGNTYPWFVKESIIWPQADLKTSTMPNFRLDHDEVEDLLAFLLAQKGQTKAISEAVYKISLAEWEAGKALPWEKPATPDEIRDLRYSMTVFATEGCAACHRLKGFASNVGFAKEKEKADFNALYNERQWFESLIPENITGSELARVLREHGAEIDKRIVDGVRENSLLEEIQEKHPGLIEAFYTPFKFAARSRGAEFAGKLLAASAPSDKQIVLQEQEQWRNRVNRVLMQYIQEYGLGRLVGPRPNWSGIYRSDEWLMEHFKAPTNHIPRSIMPIFPFDETKFYALTYMLDQLSLYNRDSVREIWANKGFIPSKAYAIHCAQCHGDRLQGNGPVSEWIYPIPKNLRSAYFLRNLTKEQAVNSILHGVKGTPMAPWGEAAKAEDKGIPVLTLEEAKQLVEWIFSDLPGETIFQGHEETPKWQYTPQDVLKELEQEGNDKKFLQSSLFALPKTLFASVGAAYTGSSAPSVTDLFDEVKDPDGSLRYYIKPKFYTAENIAAGQEFFLMNCAVCHGKDADGLGNRAGVMQDAKPRILTNLDWINSRDDLRLLRSIKYGILGTSMTPWGDLTTSMQRLQLVMFIRSLSEENNKRAQLFSALYQSFQEMDEEAFVARSARYSPITAMQTKLAAIKGQLTALQRKDAAPQDQLKLLEEQAAIATELKKAQKADEAIAALQKIMKAEQALYQSLGLAIIQQNPGLLDPFLAIIRLNEGRFKEVNGSWELQEMPSAFQKQVQELIDAAKEQPELQKRLISGFEQIKETHKRPSHE